MGVNERILRGQHGEQDTWCKHWFPAAILIISLLWKLMSYPLVEELVNCSSFCIQVFLPFHSSLGHTIDILFQSNLINPLTNRACFCFAFMRLNSFGREWRQLGFYLAFHLLRWAGVQQRNLQASWELLGPWRQPGLRKNDSHLHCHRPQNCDLLGREENNLSNASFLWWVRFILSVLFLTKYSNQFCKSF